MGSLDFTANGPSHKLQKPHGFTLIELLVVVAIMAVLASVGLPLAELANQRAKEEELRRALRDIRGALDAHKRLVDLGRIQTPVGSSGYPATLKTLTEGIPDAQSAQGAKFYLLRRLPRDPFDTQDQADDSAGWGLRSYASPPDNPQSGADVYDVYSRSNRVGLSGLPYRSW